VKEAFGLLGGAFVAVECRYEDFEHPKIAYNLVIEWDWGEKHLAYFRYRKFVRHEWDEDTEEWDAIFQDWFEVIEYNFSLDEIENRYEAGEGFYDELIKRIEKIAVEKNGLKVITDDPELFERLAAVLE